MEISQALDFVRRHKRGVVVTLRRDGRPQLSNIAYAVTDDGVIHISVTESRAKTKNLRRTPLASLHVTSDDFWSYCVLDCDVELMPVASAPDDATVDTLVDYYRSVSGEHPDWDDYRRAMVTDGRLIVKLTPTHVYGILPQ
jgi:PPOX class probable F420-dependent enzyme